MHKKSVFIFLLLSAFISLNANAQNIGVYKAISETKYSDVNIYGEPLNVLAGQSLHFCITLTEETANFFMPGNGIVKIELSNGATFSDNDGIIFGETSGDTSLARNCIPCVFSKLLTKA